MDISPSGIDALNELGAIVKFVHAKAGQELHTAQEREDSIRRDHAAAQARAGEPGQPSAQERMHLQLELRRAHVDTEIIAWRYEEAAHAAVCFARLAADIARCRGQAAEPAEDGQIYISPVQPADSPDARVIAAVWGDDMIA